MPHADPDDDPEQKAVDRPLVAHRKSSRIGKNGAAGRSALKARGEWGS
jgi:hypothetical protein